MKIDRQEIRQLALRNIKNDTHDPFEATIRAVETWMGKKGIIMVSKMEQETIKALVEILTKTPDEGQGEA